MSKIEIEISAGKEVDWETSAKLKRIVLKDQQLTYEDICRMLFKEEHYCIGVYGNIYSTDSIDPKPNKASTEHQLDCILAKNMLANVAVYLNNGWEPNLEKDFGICITLNWSGNLITDSCLVLGPYSSGKVIFKSPELARQAIEILGEETVKLALEPLY